MLRTFHTFLRKAVNLAPQSHHQIDLESNRYEIDILSKDHGSEYEYE